MEIERKYLIRQLPFSPESYPFHLIQQAYLNTDPVIRIRREDNSYYLTYKSKGLMVREEYNLPLTAEAYEHLLPKADGNLISTLPGRGGVPGRDGCPALHASRLVRAGSDIFHGVSQQYFKQASPGISCR